MPKGSAGTLRSTAVDEAGIGHRALAEIAADRTRGASQLARRCLELLAECARNCDAADVGGLQLALRKLADGLRAARPSMAPVQTLVGRWLAALHQAGGQPLQEFREQAEAKARRLIDDSRRAVQETSAHAAGLVLPGETIITHSLSSTLMGAFRLLSERGVRAVITESRPLLEGRTLAHHLSRLGIATRYITDAQMGVFMPEADLAMTGADSVLEDGSALNKAGTYLLALAARDCGVPFYVCCESFKFTRSPARDLVIEEMDAGELQPVALPHVTPRNVYFDITPPHLISGWVTEAGVFAGFGDALRGAPKEG